LEGLSKEVLDTQALEVFLNNLVQNLPGIV